MAVREYTKEQIVLLYFLVQGNEWSNADAIVRWLNSKEPSEGLGVLGDRSQIPFTLSRAGAVKICKRLVPGLLESVTTKGYRSKKVILYRLRESEDGFVAVAQRFKVSPTIFMESRYGQKGAGEYLVGRLERTNKLKLAEVAENVRWAINHSPTAMMLAIDGDLLAPEVVEPTSSEARLTAALVTLACAVRVDSGLKDRNRLLASGDEMMFFRKMLDDSINKNCSIPYPTSSRRNHRIARQR